ncbi:MAG: SDR family oxidoreductase [Gallionella sp.]
MTTIWITGGKGFIGRHLARQVSESDDIVSGIGHGLWPAEETGKWGYSNWSNGEIDAANLSQLARASGLPEVVYHLAGGSSVGASLQNPHEDFRRSVASTAQLLEWLRLNAPDASVVGVSSAAVYGAGHAGRIHEDAAVSPYSPYGTHKAMMENLCRSYAENFGLRVAIVRLFSVYGAGLEKQLIWDLCCKLAAAKSNTVLLGGTGRELRDWLHVNDAAALLALVRARCDTGCPVINGGTGIATSTREVADMACQAWGNGASAEFSGVARKGDPASLVADCTQASGLGFRPRILLAEGIRETVGWYKSRNA